MDTIINPANPQLSELEIPTAEEVFDRSYDPPPPLPPAWTGDSIAAELADRECARLLVNTCLYDPPITEEEIDRYGRKFQLSRRQAELEVREGRAARG